MTRQEDGSVLFLVYGTLREGSGNNRILQRHGVEKLGVIVTEPKYTMYSLGGFPAVVEGGQTAITGEVYRVTNEDVIDNVNSLEGYSGERNHPGNWYDTCAVQTEWGEANMFTMNDLPIRARSLNVVETGDWYNKSNKKNGN